MLALQPLFATEESRKNFVDLDLTWVAWAALGSVILVLLVIDLARHREAHAPTTREALMESLGWVACGLGFAFVILYFFGAAAFGEYLNGYLTEKALSVDNVFVWSTLFSAMAIPVKYQHRVLFWGIFGALVMRGIAIFAGARLIQRFEVMLIVFGLFLVFTGIKVMRHRDDEGEGGSAAGLGLLRRIMPISEELDGQRFFTRINGARAATPLFAALVVVEATDVIFAVDSVPAILALSNEEFLIFSSNAFAILGLRAMYFLLADAKERFHYLNHALGAILVFVGLKMTMSLYFHLNQWYSLGIIAGLLAGAIIFSERKNRQLAESSTGV